MAQPVDVVTSATNISSPETSPTSATSPASPDDLASPLANKIKGRRRLLSGFHRMSSSPSLQKFGRPSSSSGAYKNNKASVSCISLSSAGTSYGSPFGPSLSAELASDYSTAATSTASTPGIQVPYFDERARVKYLESLERPGSVPLPSTVRCPSRLGQTPGIAEESDYFSIRIEAEKPRQRRPNFNFWHDLPGEIRTEVLSYLEPKEVVRCSMVSKTWHRNCFDGQLWSILDTAHFYQNIPAGALISIITQAGPFVRDLNLRGCVQLRDMWQTKGLADACRNLEFFSLEGCRIDRTSVHCFLLQNPRLVHLNLTGLAAVTNAAMKIIAQSCPKLEELNVSWCNNVDTRGLRKVLEQCPSLRDLRAGEIRGWDDVEFMHELFQRNTLERLVLMNCDSLKDDSFKVLIEGKNSEIDYITGKRIVPPRNLKHLDLTRCRGITGKALECCPGNLVNIEGLQLSKCRQITDSVLMDLLPTMPKLTHLDLEELDDLTNPVLQTLAISPGAKSLRHLSISYCENLGDTGMLPVLKTCTNLRSLDMDNTRISDLVLAEAASMVRKRSQRTQNPHGRPSIGLRLIAFDCQNVTWTGIREVISRNAEITTQRRVIPAPFPPPSVPSDDPSSISANPPRLPSVDFTGRTCLAISTAPTSPDSVVQLTRTYPSSIIQLKCFYNYQPTVEEHTKRVLRGDFASATRLERKWADFMIATEEARAGGDGGQRRRRRRQREAQMMHADEADFEGQGAANGVVGANGSVGTGVGGGRRRRARSGGCAVM